MKTPSVLAFEKKLSVSDAFFYQKNSKKEEEAIPLTIQKKSLRGTISNRLKDKIASDEDKINEEIQKPNLQKVDFSTLDNDKDTLVVSWSLKVLSFDGIPCVCNNKDYQEKINELMNDYIHETGLRELSKRYAINIANARWLWRNRMGAKNIEVHVNSQCKDGSPVSLKFDSLSLKMNDFSSQDKNINKLASLIETGLQGKELIILQISAYAKIGYGQEVFPSQELVLDTKGKFLFQINEITGMHSQKIGNAIRSIDTWYMENAKFPIPIEPYGAVTSMGHAFRQPKNKTDFYTLLDNWMIKDKKPSIEDQHFIAAVLIRGGVFGENEKE